MQKLIGAIAEVHVDKALVAANAMLKVHNGVVDLKLGKVTDNGVDVGLFGPLAMPLTPLKVGKELKLGNKDQPEGRGSKALMKGTHRKQAARLGSLAPGGIGLMEKAGDLGEFAPIEVNTRALKHLCQRLSSSVGVDADHGD
jgi:hypothetical protein